MTTLPRPAPAHVLACGAHLKNRVCRLDGDTLQWSAPHGDLDSAEARLALALSFEQLRTAAPQPLQALAHDLHPDFASSRLARQQADALGVPAIAVQHHHAHIAAVIAERGLDAPVIGLALDGFGLGSDGAAWGGEVLWVGAGTQAHRWQRIAHLPTLALPGGDAAAREPWRMAAAVLHSLGRSDEIAPRFATQVGEAHAQGLATLLARELNCPRTSSAGRWFDAAAGALGLSVRQSHEAEAAIALERLAHDALRDGLALDVPDHGLDLRLLVASFFDIPRDNLTAIAQAAAHFHLALAQGLAETALVAAYTHGASHVVLGGGCFANRVLSQHLEQWLDRAGLTVHRPSDCGDASLALGQAWVAACAVAAHELPEMNP